MGDFDMTVGVLLLGLFFNTYLYGLVTYQFVVYHNTKFNDPLWIRLVDTNDPVLHLIYLAMQSSCWNSFRHGYLA